MKNLLAIAVIIVGIAAYVFIVSSNGAFEGMETEKGSGISSTLNVSSAAFEGIDIHGTFEVVLVQDGTQDMEISGDDNLVKLVRSEVNKGILKVWCDQKMRKSDEITLTIHSATFKQIDVHGAVELSANTPIEGESLEMNISGASDAELALQVSRFEAGISGAGDVDLTGSADQVAIHISGAGDINADELMAQRVEISISGAGNASVHAEESLDVSISGVGNVTYSGDPSVEKRISGMGSLNKK